MNSKNDWALENRIINIEAVATIASALGDLKENMVFVGGAVVSLYTDAHAADEIPRKTSTWKTSYMLLITETKMIYPENDI